MSDERELDLVPLSESEAAEIDGGSRPLGSVIIICWPPYPFPFPIPLPVPTGPWLEV